MNKKQIINELNKYNDTTIDNSLCLDDRLHNQFFLLKHYLQNRNINPEDLSEKELQRLIDFADYAGYIFW
jgi:hypothetical protein